MAAGKGLVRMSRYTPNLLNAVDVALQPGDSVQYRLLDGKEVTVKLTTDLRRHTNGAYGYEGIFSDTGDLGFADELRIFAWEGKS